MPKILNERFVFTSDTPVASGGTADVYRTFDLTEKREAAVKLFKEDFATDRILKEAYDREIKSLYDLNIDEHIVDLLDAGIDGETERRYIALEWVESNLKRFTEAHSVKNWSEFYESYGKAILDALCFAYSRRILHRDVTPKNILVTSDGKVKIADFGIAKFKGSYGSGVTLAQFKTAPYAPPEDSFDYPDARDVFSFVVTALECIHGDDLENHAHARRFLENDLQCPDRIRSVLDRAIDLNPDRRPHNIVELAELLAEADDVSSRDAMRGRIVGVIITNKVIDAVSNYTLQVDSYAVRNFVLEDLNSGTLFKQHSTRTANGTKEVVNDAFNLVTSDFSYLVKRDQNDHSYLAILHCQKINPVAIDVIQKDAVPLQCRFTLSTVVRAERSHESIDAVLLSLGDELNRLQREAVERQREQLFGKWQDALEVRREIEDRKEDPIRFDSVSFDGQRIILTPEEGQNVDIDCIGQPRLVKNRDSVSASGEIEWVDEHGITLFCEDAFDQDSVPNKGRLIFDTKQSRIAIKRQKQALDALQNRNSVRADLKSILLDPSHQDAPSLLDIDFVQRDLDDSKKDAVKAAVGTKDVLVVEGPPGTGKTKFIVEVMLQHILQEKKILLTSQTHIALDNALERFQTIVAERRWDIQMVRIGRKDDKRVGQSSRKLLLEYGVAKWLDSVKERSAAGIQTWASDNHVDLEQVRIGLAFSILRKRLDEWRELDEEVAKLEQRIVKLNFDIDALKRDPTIGGSVPLLRDELSETTRRLSSSRASLKIIEKEKEEAYKALVGLDDVGNGIYALDSKELEDYEEAYLGSDEAGEKCRKLLDLIEEWHIRLVGRKEFQSAYLSSAQVVAGTCVGVAATHLQKMEFDVCIVDEASKAMPTEIIVPMVRSKKWVIVGDTKQLPPYLGDFMEHQEICNRYSFTEEDYRRTLLDHLVEHMPSHSKKILTEQYRMAKPIGDLVSHCFYNDQLTSNKPFTAELFIRGLAVKKPVTWYSTSDCSHPHERPTRGTFRNHAEVEEIKRLLKRLQFAANAEDKTFEVAVMSGYSGQVDAMQHAFAGLEPTLDKLRIEVCTVDTYQGREADIAIYSVTRSNKEKRIGFLKERERINVALSRGKELLCIVGDSRFCRSIESNNPFRDVLKYIENSSDCALVGESQ